ncbi:TetR/AcrR family transcriptional regulator C-terminal ligand-binding domain-containing protein [Streptomyces sp. PTM05]|uniref:TetR/AcrR family transcriptional regulator C-terminal ligand-binding domain-containing protein n=1 Tax=Streptantibioticus parmotrematis TaxID=2873249 RepID=A0ABS7QP63_9ACTN|nr:TetR-like C-terminal domain-containing protein [Streptantibioticus parmotrematis]MBY8883652.1 TetR/AcrR family transcriptional regulator C-terminal ligand-binding domain-containing protein [Streptantibioticus parmotrematis]
MTTSPSSRTSARTPTPERRLPGGPVLQDSVTEAIATAFFEELASSGYARLSLEAVAKRAGAGKAAIYRRWSSKLEMTVALASAVAVDAAGEIDTGTLRGDVLAFLTDVAGALRHSLPSRIVPDLLAECARNPELAQALFTAVRDTRRANATRMLERAVERGELPPEVDRELALDLLAGPLYWRLAVIRTPTAPDYLDRLTDKLLAAFTA